MTSLVSERAKALRQTAFFSGMRAEDLGVCLSHAREIRMRKGDTLFRRGDPGSSMLVILAGQVRIALPSADGREQVLCVLKAGEVLGELALIAAGPRSAAAIAETNGRLLVIERQDMLKLLRADGELALKILGVLCDRLRATNALLESMLFHDAAGRLAATLLMLTKGRPTRQVDITQGALGERVGAARETINKKLREWQAAGIVMLSQGRITIVDAAALQRQAPWAETPADTVPQIW